jgi:tRNA(Arg) A34 adenosine deaminase TadA
VVAVGRSVAFGTYSKCHLPSIHAECDCLRRYHDFRHKSAEQMKHYTLLVFRMDGDGRHYKNSKPCRVCIKVMQKFRIHRVIYSNEDGGFTSELVEDMNQNNDAITSCGWRWRRRAAE